MRKTLVLSAILAVGFMVSGCWATNSKLMDEISKVKSEITTKTDGEIKVAKDVSSAEVKRVEARLDNESLQKLADLKEELYSLKQELKKDIVDKTAELSKLFNAIKTQLDTSKLANEDQIIQLSKDLRTVGNVLANMLDAQKEGLDRALIELQKWLQPNPGGGSEKQPPAPQDE